jgi:hypothetical protein
MVSAADWFCNINSRCHACGYNVGSDLSERMRLQCGYNAGSDLFEQMCGHWFSLTNLQHIEFMRSLDLIFAF